MKNWISFGFWVDFLSVGVRISPAFNQNSHIKSGTEHLEKNNLEDSSKNKISALEHM